MAYIIGVNYALVPAVEAQLFDKRKLFGKRVADAGQEGRVLCRWSVSILGFDVVPSCPDL